MDSLPVKNLARITFVYNIRLNNEHRVDGFLKTLSALADNSNHSFSIRLRGKFSESANLKLQKLVATNPKLTLVTKIHSSYKDWTLDLLEQVIESPSDYYCLMQEDHEFISDQFILVETLNEIVYNKIDYLGLTFYPQYSKFSTRLNENNSGFKVLKRIVYWDISKSDIKAIPSNQRNYMINLVGVFKKDLLVKILCRNRPLIKKFSKETPFNFEQSPSQTWFLPIRWALPSSELFACVDDNHGFPGYSLNSRRKVQVQYGREIEHHDILPKNIAKLSKKLKCYIRKDLEGLLRTGYYTINFWLTFAKRKKMINSLLEENSL